MSTHSEGDLLIGLAAVLVSCVLFGCEYVPIKGYQLYDGLFVQWLKCTGVLFAGCIVLAVQGFPKFHYMIAVGGIIWATGNASVVPILQMSGSLGILFWFSIEIAFGWATAYFGWLGITAEGQHNSTAQNVCEFIGVILTVVSAFIFGLVKPSEKRKPDESIRRGLLTTINVSTVTTVVDGFYIPQISNPQNDQNSSFLQRNWKMMVGCCLASMGAFLSSQAMTPITLQQQADNLALNGTTANSLNYTFSFSTGAFFGGTFYFLVYCVVLRNRPKMNPNVALPGIIYGLVWSGGYFSMIFASGHLSQSVSYPICKRLPALIMLCWDIFFFKEIRGKRNFIVLGVAVLVSIVGVVLIGLADVI